MPRSAKWERLEKELIPMQKRLAELGKLDE
jgi:hypothetical protein